MILQMSCRSLMEKKAPSKVVVFMTLRFCFWPCYPEKWSFERITWKGIQPRPYHALDDKGHGFELGADEFTKLLPEELKMRGSALKRSGLTKTPWPRGILSSTFQRMRLRWKTRSELLGSKEFVGLFPQNQNVILPKTQFLTGSTRTHRFPL